MSFWNLSDNTNAAAAVTNGVFESAGGDLAPIPAGTQLQAMIEEARWDVYNEVRFISLRWKVMAGEFKNRVIFQKLHVFGNPNSKNVQANADNAKRMLVAIDANSGGQLVHVQGEPSEHDLARCLSNKMMTIQVQVWKMETNGEKKSGNWVNAVAPRQGHAAPVQTPAPAPAHTDYVDNEIPF